MNGMRADTTSTELPTNSVELPTNSKTGAKTFHEVKASTFHEVKAGTFYEVKAGNDIITDKKPGFGPQY